MESPGLIWIPTGVAASNLRYLAAHETAHQWFYGIVGNDQAKEPFADEAAADFAARYVLGLKRGSRCATATLDRTIYEYSAACYYEKIYIQGGNLLDDGAAEDGLGRVLGRGARLHRRQQEQDLDDADPARGARRGDADRPRQDVVRAAVPADLLRGRGHDDAREPAELGAPGRRCPGRRRRWGLPARRRRREHRQPRPEGAARWCPGRLGQGLRERARKRRLADRARARPDDAEPHIDKDYGDAFEATSLESVLSRLGVGRLFVVGANTDACVRSTIHGAFVRGYDTTLVSDAHTTVDKTAAGAPPPDQVVAHTNMYWTRQKAPGRTAGTVATDGVDFGGG